MLDKFRRDVLEYIGLLLAAGAAMFLIFLFIEPRFGLECLVASLVLAGLWAALEAALIIWRR